jgi:hypothetical protein
VPETQTPSAEAARLADPELITHGDNGQGETSAIWDCGHDAEWHRQREQERDWVAGLQAQTAAGQPVSIGGGWWLVPDAALCRHDPAEWARMTAVVGILERSGADTDEMLRTAGQQRGRREDWPA